MLDIEEFNSENFNSEIIEDIGVLQYLYYDLKTDLDAGEMQDLYFGETFEDVKELTEAVLEKYNAEGMLDLNVFEGKFTQDEYLKFYSDINKVYNKIVEHM